jgi:hypothetical protein
VRHPHVALATGSPPREEAETMLREVLGDEPQWAAILEVVPLELEIATN